MSAKTIAAMKAVAFAEIQTSLIVCEDGRAVGGAQVKSEGRSTLRRKLRSL